ncbi:MAG: hypothetical protein ACFFFH_12220 [Candidatus Thorarchaeota archaeon]
MGPKKNFSHNYSETPIEESLKYLYLRTYLKHAKEIREAWNASKSE